MNARTLLLRGRPLVTIAACLVALSSLLFLGGLVAATEDAAELPPAWHCLPAETTVAVRIPNGKAFANALRKHTKLGAVVFSDKRVAKFKTMIMEQDPQQWETFKDDLAEYGLDPDDFADLLAGESGFALLIDQVDDETPAAIGLSWIEPGDELAQRVLSAVGKAIADQEDNEDGPKRLDVEIDDHQVMQLSIPVTTVVGQAAAFELPENFNEMAVEEQQQFIKEWQQRQEQGQETVVKYNHMLLARLGGRLIAANSFVPNEDDEAEPQRLTAIFAQFLTAHEGEEGGFVARIESADGVKRSLPQKGVGMFELFADVSSLIRLGDSDENVARVINALGVDAMDVLALRATLDGTFMRMGMFLAAPEPRTGILALLDQPPLPPKPPAWVPSSVVGYSHTSADLGKMYSHIKELILREFGQEAQMPFQMAEGQAQAMAQADLATILSSIGHEHMVLTLEPEIADAQADDDQPMQQEQKIAIVWRPKQEELLSRVLTAASALAGNNLTAAQEQGFNGWRFGAGIFEGGLMLGNGYMVFGLGRGVLEKTLSALNQPLEGADAMLTGEVFKQARQMMALEPGLSFQILDGRRYSKMLKQMLDAMLSQMEWQARQFGDAGGDRDALDWIGNLRKVLPSDEEMEDVLGPSVGTLHVDDLGMVMMSVNELPAP